MRSSRWLAAAAGAAAALALSACSSTGASPALDQAPDDSAHAASAPSVAAVAALAQSTAEQDGLEQLGADYAAALAEGGLPLPPASNHTTLAQVARGICGQLDAGTSESEIRAQLQPFALYAVSQTSGQLDEAQAGQAYLDAARSHVC